jgi:hypothetical protein
MLIEPTQKLATIPSDWKCTKLNTELSPKSVTTDTRHFVVTKDLCLFKLQQSLSY